MPKRRRKHWKNPLKGFEAFQFPDWPHKGKPITRVPQQALDEWARTKGSFDRGLAFAIRRYLSLVSNQKSLPPATAGYGHSPPR